MRITLWHGVTGLTVLLGCASRVPEPATSPSWPSAAYLQRLRPFVGCYALDLGPWRDPDDRYAPSLGTADRPAFLPPAVVRLDTILEQNRIRVLPAPDAASGFGLGGWGANQDSVRLWWPKAGSGSPATLFIIRLGAVDGRLAGRASMDSDVRYSRPYRMVEARRVSCRGI